MTPEQAAEYKRLNLQHKKLYRDFKRLMEAADTVFLAFYKHRQEIESYMEDYKDLVIQQES